MPEGRAFRSRHGRCPPTNETKRTRTTECEPLTAFPVPGIPVPAKGTSSLSHESRGSNRAECKRDLLATYGLRYLSRLRQLLLKELGYPLLTDSAPAQPRPCKRAARGLTGAILAARNAIIKEPALRLGLKSQFAQPKNCCMCNFSFNGGKSTTAWQRSSSGALPWRPILCPSSFPSETQTSALFIPKEKSTSVDLSRNASRDTRWSSRCGQAFLCLSRRSFAWAS